MTALLKRYRWVIAAFAFAALLIAVIFGIFSIDNATNKMIVAYVESLGWEVENAPVEISHLTIPTEFDVVYNTYNAVQKNSGFDLIPFKGKGVSRYSYRVLNHKMSQSCEVIASVLVYENRIIAGDICSTELNGFMHAISETTNIMNK